MRAKKLQKLQKPKPQIFVNNKKISTNIKIDSLIHDCANNNINIYVVLSTYILELKVVTRLQYKRKATILQPKK